MLTIDEILGRDGVLAKSMDGYEFRPAQIAMGKLVNRGFLEHVHIMVEAGTGTGKSFGYLVPAILSGQRVVISTATLALQEQLLTKDIPQVINALDSPARVVQLKGRNNYLCRDKLEQLRGRLVLAQGHEDRKLFRWADHTRSGDRAELDFVPAEALWREVDADAFDCIMEACDFFGPERCHQMHAREAARQADIIVVNHALFFSDLAMGGGVIPPYDYVILDEAHQIEEWATAAFASSISRAAVARLQHKLARAYIVDELLNAALNQAADEFALALEGHRASRYPFHENASGYAALEPLQRALYRVENWVAERWATASRFPQATEDALKRRRDLILRLVVGFTQTIERLRLGGEDWICWVERGEERRGSYAANCAPASVNEILRERLYDRTRSVVMTSATISTGGDFAYLRRQVGLYDVALDELVLDSAFDFPQQAMLYLPPQRLNPKRESFILEASPVIEEVLLATRGRAFVLFTSNAVMRAVAHALGPRLPFPYLVQGDMPKGATLQWFRSQSNPVLFATASFWEGVDVTGSALSCVIIDRLPFPPPDDPIIAARSKLLAQAGGDPFRTLMIPAAITKLKQGLGRLIRSASDKGLMCILDGRIETMAYGREILKALPPARRIHDLSAVTEFLAERSPLH
ncbi:MAG: ATP-dependent DNA helicase, partial [Candidatus Eremiobacteraeota bacterium]|nr:ATP-dependent DNA helicase [Candidatus Eremiobacteraeota bacterium]